MILIVDSIQKKKKKKVFWTHIQKTAGQRGIQFQANFIRIIH